MDTLEGCLGVLQNIQFDCTFRPLSTWRMLRNAHLGNENVDKKLNKGVFTLNKYE